ncbi:MAG TPA: hypothetical protein VMJ10_02275 [Kofleriaceae bacterium]|nr:hypothetical protein [Kofleriaceae bacterium]
MQDLLEAIRVAMTDGATAEQKATGAQACQTILAALGAQPGTPIVLPGVPKPHPLSALSVDQALELVIARLRAVADARDKQAAQPTPATQATPATAASTAPRGPRIPIVPPRPPTAPGGAWAAQKKP